MTRPRVGLIVVATLVFALLLLLPDRGRDDPSSDAASAAASTLLDVELATFEGAPARLRSYAGGKPLVVNFFASWCGPCVREMPDLEAVAGRRGGEVRFIGVNLKDDSAAAAELVQSTGVTYDVLRDESGQLFRAVRGFSMPTTVFLAPDGGVFEVHGGELSQAALESRIDRLIER